MKAVICPVCDGTGEVNSLGSAGSEKWGTPVWYVECHGCAGKGWVEIHEDCPPVTITYEYPYTIYPYL